MPGECAWGRGRLSATAGAGTAAQRLFRGGATIFGAARVVCEPIPADVRPPAAGWLWLSRGAEPSTHAWREPGDGLAAARFSGVPGTADAAQPGAVPAPPASGDAPPSAARPRGALLPPAAESARRSAAGAVGRAAGRQLARRPTLPGQKRAQSAVPEGGLACGVALSPGKALPPIWPASWQLTEMHAWTPPVRLVLRPRPSASPCAAQVPLRLLRVPPSLPPHQKGRLQPLCPRLRWHLRLLLQLRTVRSLSDSQQLLLPPGPRLAFRHANTSHCLPLLRGRRLHRL